VVALALAFFPFAQTVAPDWTVTILDAAHQPMSRITVREVWQQYSLENASHEENLFTDSSGQVHFPRRTYRSNFVTRFVSCVGRIGDLGVHASCGPKSYLVAFGMGADTMDWTDMNQENGGGMPWQRSTLILNH
jgi:hypothetical protein